MRKKITIEEMQKIAAERGGKCLSNVYIDAHTKMKWICKEGHIWETSASYVIYSNSWCSECKKIAKEQIFFEKMSSLAAKKNGKYLNKLLVDGKIILRFKCEKGHVWETTQKKIEYGSWCTECKRIKSLEIMINKAKKLARKKNGLCLTKILNNKYSKLKWQCEKGHIWESIFELIRIGRWCPYCCGNKLNLNIISEDTKKHGIICLSKEYIPGKKLKWQCEKGHIWDSYYNNVKRIYKCPVCSGKKLTIDVIKEFAKTRGGKCLSEKYINGSTKLLFECADGHQWYSVYSRIRDGGWCSYCTRYISEQICRQFFENLFNKKFPKNKPKWLISLKGGRMEFDGFCMELNLAFEYNVIQHYENAGAGRNSNNLHNTIKRDKLKIILAKKNKVCLIVVPYSVEYKDMQNFIISECEKNNIIVPNKNKKLDYKKFNIHSESKIKQAQTIAAEKDGFCLSKQYIPGHRLKWMCKKGHVWKRELGPIKDGQWCPTCGGSQKLTKKEIEVIANEKNSKLLSKKYINAGKKLEFQCNVCNNIWSTLICNIKNEKIVCSKCRKNEKNKNKFQKLKNIVKEKNGIMLSEIYKNSSDKYEVQCSCGNKFLISCSSLEANRWCPRCTKKNTIIKKQKIRNKKYKKQLKYLQDMAKKNNIICLSKSYQGNTYKLQFKCKKGHQWKQTPAIIREKIKKNKEWCPFCSETRFNLEIVQKIAIDKGFLCISNYFKPQIKLQFKCKEGHIFNAFPSRIKTGKSQCPECTKNKIQIGDIK